MINDQSLEAWMTRKLDLVTGETNSGDLAAQIETLRTEMANLAASVSDLIAKSSAVGSGLSAKVAQSVEKTAAQAGTLASEFTSHSLENLTAAGDKAKDASLQLVDAVAAEVRKNPGRTLAITLGIGMLLGLMSRSSSK
jgi:ElaB/YqjD/DUF883 family membrane-anchored ribosome-binding protein